jgi:hypothetical protein
MPFELNGFSDSILEQLSKLSIEIFGSKESEEAEELVPKAIYEISKHQSKKDKKK